MKKYIYRTLLWFPFVLLALTIVSYFFGWEDCYSCTLLCGPLFLIISGTLWIVNRIKFGSINKEFNSSEKEAEEALAAEIEAIKGNSLKKELVKRKLVREYIEKRRLELSQTADYLKSEFLSKLAYNYGLSGYFLALPFLLLYSGIMLISLFLIFDFPNYWSIENVIFAVLVVGMLLCKRTYIAALVVGVQLVIFLLIIWN